MDGSSVAFSAVTSEITIGDKTYKVSPLKMVDRSQAERRIRDRRITHMLERCRGVPLPDEVVGTAIAKIECATVSLDELLDTSESRIYLLWLALKRGGTALSEQQVADLPPMEAKVLGAIMLYINGIEKEDGEDEARPTMRIAGSLDVSEDLIGVNS